MALNDEIKMQRQKLKGAPLKEKCSYIWHYYKGPILTCLLIVAIIITYISKLDDPKIILHGYMLNHFNNDLEESLEDIEQEFLSEYKYDSTRYTVNINTALSYYFSKDEDVSTSNYQTMETLLAKSASGEIGFITGNQEALLGLAYSDFFNDLRDIMNDEQLKRYQPYFLYIDETVMSEFLDTGITLTETSDIKFPDMSKPETMKNPIPVLVNISSFASFTDLYKYSPETLCFGISSTKEPETVLQFLEYMTTK